MKFKLILLSLLAFTILQADTSAEKAGKKRLEKLRIEMKKEEKQKLADQKDERKKMEKQRLAEERRAKNETKENVKSNVRELNTENPIIIIEEESPEVILEEATLSRRELYKKRRELNESIEEKIFKSSNKDLKTKIETTKEAYKLGKDRIDFLVAEEEQLLSLEKAIGIKQEPKEAIYLNKKYDEIGEKIKKSNSVSEILMLENEKLESYLLRLDEMEAKLKNKK